MPYSRIELDDLLEDLRCRAMIREIRLAHGRFAVITVISQRGIGSPDGLAETVAETGAETGTVTNYGGKPGENRDGENRDSDQLLVNLKHICEAVTILSSVTIGSSSTIGARYSPLTGQLLEESRESRSTFAPSCR